MQVQNLKGFRDFLPQEARKRQYVLNTIRSVFQSYGFEPLETPALEYEEILTGKYGEEGEKLMFKFEDNGGRKVAMRYDLTVPLARVVAQYQNELPTPFKRYQIQSVWRGDNPQKGRFREFTQCDGDIVGINSAMADAELIAMGVKAIEALKIPKCKIIINDRSIFGELAKELQIKDEDLPKVIRAIDKLKKVGREKVLEEIISAGNSVENATIILETIEQANPTGRIQEVFQILEKTNVSKDRYVFEPTLARGLDYYTGLIFEIEIDGYSAGSVGGGGRYDNLIGMFSGRDIPAAGISFGIDRLIDALDELNLLPESLQTSSTQVLVTIFNREFFQESITIVENLRESDINAELYPDLDADLSKQMKYADRKVIPYVVVVGPEEVSSKTVTVKDLRTREQKTVKVDELPNVFKK